MKTSNLLPVPPEKERCGEKNHVFTIIHGVGQYYGMPVWICVRCNKKVFST